MVIIYARCVTCKYFPPTSCPSFCLPLPPFDTPRHLKRLNESPLLLSKITPSPHHPAFEQRIHTFGDIRLLVAPPTVHAIETVLRATKMRSAAAEGNISTRPKTLDLSLKPSLLLLTFKLLVEKILNALDFTIRKWAAWIFLRVGIGGFFLFFGDSLLGFGRIFITHNGLMKYSYCS